MEDSRSKVVSASAAAVVGWIALTILGSAALYMTILFFQAVLRQRHLITTHDESSTPLSRTNRSAATSESLEQELARELLSHTQTPLPLWPPKAQSRSQSQPKSLTPAQAESKAQSYVTPSGRGESGVSTGTGSGSGSGSRSESESESVGGSSSPGQRHAAGTPVRKSSLRIEV